MKKDNLIHVRTCVYNCNYHMVCARQLFIKLPELKKQLWDGHLWNSSFYIETVGSVSEEAITTYIEKQKKK